MDKRLKKIRIAAHLLPPPGGEIVWDLVGEIDILKDALLRGSLKARDQQKEIRYLRVALNRQKAYLSHQLDDLHYQIQNERFGRYRYDDLVDQRKLLLDVRDENRQIWKELKLDERVHTEPTVVQTEAPMVYDPETGVPILPMPEFCTTYSCVSTSEGENWEGNKHNCIGDETRRLTRNENGFLVCPACNRSYGGRCG